MDKIKLVIWDLDDTFWKGTLAEGDVEIDQDNINYVKNLSYRGIVNSICSKNDFDQVKRILVKNEIWNYFVFSSINYEPKGQRIKQIISDMNLRDNNVLFLDDNLNNLNEAKFYNPNLNIDLPSNLKEIFDTDSFLGKDDKDLTRLKQYQILEKKLISKKNFSSNEEFLRSSDIKVNLCKNCIDEVERIYELIHRTNQLNFTKNRITKEELLNIINDSSYKNVYIKVSDKFGDHGIVGFYSLKENTLIQFVFSCRILGMGVEQYVYAKLNFPNITVKEPVASVLKKDFIPDWINNIADNNTTSAVVDKNYHQKRVILYGTCPLRPIWSYLEKKLKNAKFAEIDPLPSVLNIAVTLRENINTKNMFLNDFSNLNRFYTFDDEFLNDDEKYIIISFNDEMKLYRYQHLNSYFYSCKSYNYDKNKYVEHQITYLDLKLELNYILSNINKKINILALTLPEVEFTSKGKDADFYDRIEINKILEECSSKYENFYLIDIRKYAKSQSDFFDSISSHYNREIGYYLSNDILNTIGLETSNSDQHNLANDTFKYNNIIIKVTSKIKDGIYYISFNSATNEKIQLQILCDKLIVFNFDEASSGQEYSSNISYSGLWRSRICLSNFNKGYFTKSFFIDEYNYFNFNRNNRLQETTFFAKNKNIEQFKSRCVKYISELSSSNINFFDYFKINRISEIVLFIDKSLIDIVLPYAINSNIKINSIFTNCNKDSYRFNDHLKFFNFYNFHDINFLDLNIPIFMACNKECYDIFSGYLKDKPNLIITISDVISEMMTYNFFIKKVDSKIFSNLFCLRMYEMRRNNNFVLSSLNPTERAIVYDLRDNNYAFDKLNKSSFIYDNLSTSVLDIFRETLKTPKYSTINNKVILKDITGKYLNINNGFRKTFNSQNKKTKNIYILGGSFVFGCCLDDFSTIPSNLQKILAQDYKVHNYSNYFNHNNIYNSIELITSLNISEDDLVIFSFQDLENYSPNLSNWLNFNTLKKYIPSIDTYDIIKTHKDLNLYYMNNAITPEFSNLIAQKIAGDILQYSSCNDLLKQIKCKHLLNSSCQLPSICNYNNNTFIYFSRIIDLFKEKLSLNNTILYIEKSIDVDPYNVNRRILLSYIHMKNNNFEQAEKVLLDAYNKFSSSLLCLELAKLYDKKGDLKSAIEYARKSVLIDPNNLSRKSHLSNLLRKNKNYDEALDLMLDAMKNYPSSSEPLTQLAIIYDQKGDLKSAIEYAKKSVSIDPNNLSRKLHLSNLLRKNMNYDEALDLMLDAMKKYPLSSEPLTQLAIIYDQKGDFELAIKYAKKSASIDPDNISRIPYLSNLLSKE